MKKLVNNSGYTLIHGDIKFIPGEIKDIPAEIASIWLKINGVKEYADPKEVKAEKEALLKEIKKLKTENIKLQKQLEDLTVNEAKKEEKPAKTAKQK